MNNAMKGLMLSGLVFPGVGQLVLKRYLRGIVLILTVLACLVMLTVQALEKAFMILDRIQSAGGVIDMNTVTDAATQATSSSDNLVFNGILLLLLLIWIVGSFDAYRLGKQKDQSQQPEARLADGGPH